ncbi:MAG: hypothetical protein PUC12_13510 [Clostridiales bacterium]|nr:hypothetical protein [Clostridiales bacterium]
MEEDNTLKWGNGFQKSEALVLAEKIYACKCEIRDLEWELDDEQFHFRYVSKRKERVIKQAGSRLIYIIPLGWMLVSSIIFTVLLLIGKLGEISGESGVQLLFLLLFIVFGGYFFVKFLMIPEMSQLILLWNSRNTDKAMRKAREKGLNTFQKDYAESKCKIEYIKERISKLTDDLKELIQKQEELLKYKEKAEERLRKENVLFDVKPGSDGKISSFSLKKSTEPYVDLSELYEYYQKEKAYYRGYLEKLDVRLCQMNKELVDIDEQFDMAKKRILFFAVGYILVVIVQQVFTGILSTVTALICLIVSVLVIINLESKCTPAILNYLVEEENELVKEYAFCHNKVPVKYKREEILEEKKKVEVFIKDLEDQQKKLDTLMDENN